VGKLTHERRRQMARVAARELPRIIQAGLPQPRMTGALSRVAVSATRRAAVTPPGAT
jgi:hypothetical protein